MQIKWQRAQSLSSHCGFDSYDSGRAHYAKTYAKYFEYVGIPADNLMGISVIEIGCGHFPGVTFCRNAGTILLIDPLNSHFMVSSCSKNYPAAAIRQEPAETAQFFHADEIWIFNVLSHVINPSAIIEKCKRYARTIRFFEPINIRRDESNINSLSIDFFRSHFGDCVKHYPHNKNAVAFHQHECAYGVYINKDFKDNPDVKLPSESRVIYPPKKNTFNFRSIKKYCISLKRSKERKEEVTKEFKKIGERFEFFEAVDGQRVSVPALCKKHAGVFACMQSHVALIRMAKARGLPAVAVFEDDVVFCDDFQERIKYIESLHGFDFDIFCLGGHFSSANESGRPTEWSHIQGIASLGGTYGYIFKASVYDFILENCTYEFGADEFYGTHVYKRFRTFAFVPFLVGCRPCKSEITGAYWEYENIGWTYRQASMGLFRKEKNK